MATTGATFEQNHNGNIRHVFTLQMKATFGKTNTDTTLYTRYPIDHIYILEYLFWDL